MPDEIDRLLVEAQKATTAQEYVAFLGRTVAPDTEALRELMKIQERAQPVTFLNMQMQALAGLRAAVIHLSHQNIPPTLDAARIAHGLLVALQEEKDGR